MPPKNQTSNQVGPRPFTPAAPEGERTQGFFRAALAIGLLGLGLYILSDFLRALVWAVVLAVALWPLYERALRFSPPGRHNILWPALFTGLVALALLLPVLALAVEALREAHDVLAYAARPSATASRCRISWPTSPTARKR